MGRFLLIRVLKTKFYAPFGGKSIGLGWWLWIKLGCATMPSRSSFAEALADVKMQVFEKRAPYP
jgi:hypothetical protein